MSARPVDEKLAREFGLNAEDTVQQIPEAGEHLMFIALDIDFYDVGGGDFPGPVQLVKPHAFDEHLCLSLVQWRDLISGQHRRI